MPQNIPNDWDYLAVMNACIADAYHHCVWLLLEKAVRRLGLLDLSGGSGLGGSDTTSGPVSGSVEAEMIRERIGKEALQAALRIAHLVSPSTSYTPTLQHFRL